MATNQTTPIMIALLSLYIFFLHWVTKASIQAFLPKVQWKPIAYNIVGTEKPLGQNFQFLQLISHKVHPTMKTNGKTMMYT
jgi:hypothetical protein